ncbi:MAG: hypothetical protein ACYSWS_12265, partial [Planctomycetota bacterium]
MGINIYKPDIGIVDWFDTICNSLGLITTLSHVEMAIDFSPYEYELHEFFWKHLFLKYHSGGSCSFEDGYGSFYIGHKAKNSKSLILYQKPLGGINVLRMEIRLNRAYIKRLGLELDCIERVKDLDLSRLVSFKQLNREKLLKHLKWRHKPVLSELDDEDDKDLFIHQLSQIPSA